MANRKQAVDTTAEAYWEQYFGPYGAQWVRKIPRRVASALIGGLREAANRDGTAEVRVKRAQIGGINFVQTKDGGLIFEGIFRGQIERGGQTRVIARLFRADFAQSGKMVRIRSQAA